MRYITYIRAGGDPDNKDDTLVFASRPFPGVDALISKGLMGFGGLTAEFSTVKVAGKAGEIVQNVSLPPRIINDTVTLLAKDEQQLSELRRKITYVLDPMAGEGTLLYKDAGGEYSIRAIPKTNAADSGRISKRACKMAIEFFCPSPYFCSLIKNEIRLFAAGKGAKMPFAFPLVFEADTRNLYVANASAQSSAPMFVVTGRVKNIRIGIGGDWVVVPITTEPYDIVTIDCEKQQTTIERAGIKSVLYPSLNSVYPKLSPGINNIRIGFDIFSDDVTVSASWAPSFLGV